jgi:hypothetical protein
VEFVESPAVADLTGYAAPSDEGVGRGVVRGQLECVLQKHRGDPGIRRHRRRHVRQSSQIDVVGVEIFRTLSPGVFDLRLPKARFDDADNSVGDLILQVEYVLQRAVEPVGPQMRSSLSFEQLGGDANAFPALRTPPSST